jgi:hypothetical protein
MQRQNLGLWLSLAWATGCSSLLGDPFEDWKPRVDSGTPPDDGAVDSGAREGAGIPRPPLKIVDAPDADPSAPDSGHSAPAARSGKAKNQPAAISSQVEPAQATPSDAGPAPSADDDPDDAGAYLALDDCTPDFLVSNGIIYPRRSAGPRVFEARTARHKIDTDRGSPDCDPADPDNCVVAASSIYIARGADVGVSGERPLVLLAAGDITLDGILNVAGGDGNQSERDHGGPGDHSRGMSKSVSGGGGNATQGGGNCDGVGAGPSIPSSAGLIGGGHGSKQPDDVSMYCIAGGGGGGAVQIVSLCGAIRISWFLNARGGGGRGGAQNLMACPDGNGGGAGGTVWLQGHALSFGDTLEFVQLSGGGGGGGSCRRSAGDMPTPGSPGQGSPEDARGFQASGAACGDIAGGRGGGGGRRESLPMRGGEPTPADMPALTRCGGGGGARGRIVLQNLPNTCDEIANYTDGACVVAEPAR